MKTNHLRRRAGLRHRTQKYQQEKKVMNRFKFFVTQLLAVALLTAPLAVAPLSAQTPAPAKILYPTDRTILPIPEPRVANSTVFNARNATAPERFEVKAPAGAPNVLIV